MIAYKFKILIILYCLTYLTAHSQKSDYIIHNRTIEQVVENNKLIVRFSEGQGAGVAWIKDLEFSEGIIEFDAKGRDVLQKKFYRHCFSWHRQ